MITAGTTLELAVGLALAPTTQELALYTGDDVPWIATIVDHVEAAVGQPWRVLRERLEHVTHGEVPIRPARVAAIVAALRRMLGGRAERVRIARRLRGLVLGHPALDAAARAERLRAASDELGIAHEELADLLWIDLADERPVALPGGRPSELRLAAFANLDRIQREVRRAASVRLTVWGDAHALIRTAARCGLLATVTSRATPAGPAVVLEVDGPLSLFHATSVYGRALAALVPLLAGLPRFQLEILGDARRGPALQCVLPPVLLPPVLEARGRPSLAARLARDLAKLAPAAGVALDPPPLVHGADLLFPDIALAHAGRRWCLELVGFATADYLAAKLARYHAAGITDVLLLVDEARAIEFPRAARAQLLGFRGRPSAAAVLAEIVAVGV